VRVLATAGHVDHGKSTLVRALTGMEPDRWAEERRRGMTIDLGYAWTTLADGTEIAFVDVPGHQRFIGNMLAGLGPVPAVLFVVAADEGWSRQSEEHLAAAHALGITHGLLAVTRSDLADPAVAIADSHSRLARSTLGDVEVIAVSGATGAGVPELRAAIERLVTRLPAPDPRQPVRLWVDRVFTVRGSGTVITGTLGSGTVDAGDQLEMRGHLVSVRGIQCLGAPRDTVSAPARVALNLRGVARDEVRRGDVLLTPDAWHWTTTVDARVQTRERLPEQLILHVGTAALPVRLRRLGGVEDDVLARLQLPQPVAVRAGDRAVLRDPGQQTVAGGVLVLDADPPPLTLRGAAAARAVDLASAGGALDSAREIARRGAMRHTHLVALGGQPPEGTRELDGWLIDESAWQGWTDAAAPAVAAWAERDPLEPAMPISALRRALKIPTDAIVADVAAAASLAVRDGRVHQQAQQESLGPAEPAVRRLEERLQEDPFAAPEAYELQELRLGRRELAAAERCGRLLRLTDQIVLLPAAPAEAVRRLRELPQPFTTSEARAALNTTRRVAIPLLEHLDARGDTERLDASRRRVRPRP
jgi:selenocysteine-specific elongation factor